MASGPQGATPTFCLFQIHRWASLFLSDRDPVHVPLCDHVPDHAACARQALCLRPQGTEVTSDRGGSRASAHRPFVSAL